MKIFRNQLCPCRSGKKYKNCCSIKNYKNKENLEKLNKFYASLKYINDSLLKRTNCIDYIDASFSDTLDLSITCNALSLIKSILQNNCYSITNALNLRNIIECITLINMNEKGTISEQQKELLSEQYKIIEYYIYVLDGSEEFEELIDKQDLLRRYEEGKNAFFKNGVNEHKIKKIAKTRIPFLCEEKVNYNKLIKINCPEFLDDYVILSKIVHPSSYIRIEDKTKYETIVKKIVRMLFDRYSIYKCGDKLSFDDEQSEIYSDSNIVALRLKEILEEQCKELYSLSNYLKVNKHNEEIDYLIGLLDELLLVIYDVNTDSQLGYCENAKIKYKVIAELLACYNNILLKLLDKSFKGYYFKMLTYHELLKNDKQEESDCVVENSFQLFQQQFSQSSIDKHEFAKKFKKPLGYLMDDKGIPPTYMSLVKEYLASLYGEERFADKNIFIKNFMFLTYKESNYMSHGSGYLYFVNIGAWNDDVSVIRFIDYAVCELLDKISNLYKKNNKYKQIPDRLEKSVKILRRLYNEKMYMCIDNPKRVKNN